MRLYAEWKDIFSRWKAPYVYTGTERGTRQKTMSVKCKGEREGGREREVYECTGSVQRPHL